MKEVMLACISLLLPVVFTVSLQLELVKPETEKYSGCESYQDTLTSDLPSNQILLKEPSYWMLGDIDGDCRMEEIAWAEAGGAKFFVFDREQPGSEPKLIREIQFGLPGDIPLVADLNYDGRADILVYRRSTGEWHLLSPATGETETIAFGGPQSFPFVHDFDGDGLLDLALYERRAHPKYRYISSKINRGAQRFFPREIGLVGWLPDKILPERPPAFLKFAQYRDGK